MLSEDGKRSPDVTVSHSSGEVLSDVESLLCEDAVISDSPSVFAANIGKVFNIINRTAKAAENFSCIFICFLLQFIGFVALFSSAESCEDRIMMCAEDKSC